MELQLLDDVEAVDIAYALHKRHQKRKTKVSKRRYWVHPINLKRPQEGQFNVNVMILRAHPVIQKSFICTTECPFSRSMN